MRLFFLFKIIFLCVVVIILRGTLPRYRIDSLINLTWKNLVFSLLLFFLLCLYAYIYFNF